MNRQTRVMFLLHLPPPVHGSSVMGMNIKNSDLINRTFNCCYINLLASKSVAESGKISTGKIVDFVILFSKLLASLVKWKPDVCYVALTTTGAAFYKDLILISLLKIFRVRRVYHLHNKGVSLHQHKLIARFSYRYVFKQAEVILLSKRLYSDIQAFVPEANIHICPNGLRDEVSVQGRCCQVPAPQRQETRTNKRVQILFLSNLSKAKGVFVLLEACALLKEKGLPFDCVFIGSEGDITVSQFDEHVHRLQLSAQVSYLGKRYGADKHSAFAESDLFVFPTYFETFGLVNLEAMQHSLPVVSTVEGGIPDIIDNNVTGFLVPPKSAVSLSEKLELLIKSPALRQQMGTAGRVKYEQEFTFEKFECTFTAILTSIAANGSLLLAKN